jgi:hypothetical protein
MRGVSYYNQRKKWRVRISEEKKRKHLGYFETEKEAINCLENYKSNVMGACNDDKRKIKNQKKEVKTVEASTQTEEMEEIITRMINQKIEY